MAFKDIVIIILDTGVSGYNVPNECYTMLLCLCEYMVLPKVNVIGQSVTCMLASLPVHGCISPFVYVLQIDIRYLCN